MAERPVFELEFIALPDHIDELGHVNNAVWVQWIQQMAVAHWEAESDPAHRDSYFWVVVRHEIDYLRPAREGDRIIARTWVGEAPQGARFDRFVEFTGEDGKPAFGRGLSGRSSSVRPGARSAFRRRW